MFWNRTDIDCSTGFFVKGDIESARLIMRKIYVFLQFFLINNYATILIIIIQLFFIYLSYYK